MDGALDKIVKELKQQTRIRAINEFEDEALNQLDKSRLHQYPGCFEIKELIIEVAKELRKKDV